MVTLRDYNIYTSFSYSDFKKFQLSKLIPFIALSRTNSPYYKKKFQDLPTIKSYDNFTKLPLLNQEILREYDINELRAVKWNEVVTVSRSSGSTGKSKIILWSKDSLIEDIKWGILGYLLQGLTSQSRLAILMPFEMSRIMSIARVCEEIGAFYIPIGRIRDDIDSQNAIYFIKNLKATHILGSPARLNSTATKIKEIGLNILKDFSVSHLLTGGSILSPAMRTNLETTWEAEVFLEAGANELSFLGFECKHHNGLHLTPGLHYVEILDENTHEPVYSGKSGEIVVTQFSNLATPLIRYKLGDRGYLITDKCKCGLAFPRLFIEGRIGGIITLGGTKIYAYQIENILSQFNKLSLFYQVQIEDVNKSTVIKLLIETTLPDKKPQLYKNTIIQKLSTDPLIVYEIYDKIRNKEVIFDIVFVKPGSLERSAGDKVKNQYWDKRSLI